MAEHKPLYRDTFSDAQRLGEVEQWRESHMENVRCCDFITESIDQNYDGHRLGGDVAGDAIARYGFDRVNWVLANTIRQYDYDGRISAENKAWAKGFHIPRDDSGGGWDHQRDFMVPDRTGLVDMVARDARQAWDALRLFHGQQCASVFDFETVAGQVLVLRPPTAKAPAAKDLILQLVLLVTGGERDG
ncbi:MAG: DUF3849 domain-containing protein [Oscillospiraceae bacterium]|nr:DUF3849 domain-containing protein [Oscillospiraceae bacterium]